MDVAQDALRIKDGPSLVGGIGMKKPHVLSIGLEAAANLNIVGS